MSSRSRGTKRSGSVGRTKHGSRGRSSSATFGHSGTTTPYGKGTPSVKRRDVYDALRREGKTKTVAAKIANAVANGTNGHGVRGRAGGGRKGPLVKH
ncbi:hypothetical protein SEA_FUNSIZED_77 [Mycobacterium phage Funsized]|nr:hypothetical protein SEA_FUNSIZED_77 [Mycobacterium phage Funsized]